MNPAPYSIDLIRMLLVLVMVSAAFLLTRKSITALFSIYAAQSLGIAAIAFLMYLQEGYTSLLFLAALTIISKCILVPYILRRIHADIAVKRDAQFSYLSPIGSIVLSIAIIVVVYSLFSHLKMSFLLTPAFYAGAILGVSLSLIGLLIMMSRKQMIIKVLGYLSMENGAVLVSIFMAELPFIIEIFLLMDLLMLVLIAAMLAFGIHATIEEFHGKINPFRHWFKGGVLK